MVLIFEKKQISNIVYFRHFKFSKTRSFPSKSYRSAALFHHLIKVFYLFRVWWRKGARNDSATGAAWKHISCPAALKQVNLCNHAATHHEKSPVKKFKKKKCPAIFPKGGCESHIALTFQGFFNFTPPYQ